MRMVFVAIGWILMVIGRTGRCPFRGLCGHFSRCHHPCTITVFSSGPPFLGNDLPCRNRHMGIRPCPPQS